MMRKPTSSESSGSFLNGSHVSSASGSVNQKGRPNTTPITSIRIVPKKAGAGGGVSQSVNGGLQGSSQLVLLGGSQSPSKHHTPRCDDFVEEEVEDYVMSGPLHDDDDDDDAVAQVGSHHPKQHQKQPQQHMQDVVRYSESDDFEVDEEAETAGPSPSPPTSSSAAQQGTTTANVTTKPTSSKASTGAANRTKGERRESSGVAPVPTNTSKRPVKQQGSTGGAPSSKRQPSHLNGQPRVVAQKPQSRLANDDDRRPITADPVLDHSGSKKVQSSGQAPQPPQSIGGGQRKLRVNVSHKALIGKGSFGVVYQAMDRDTNHIVACKEICLVKGSGPSADPVPLIRQELAMLKQLDHPNIVKYLGEDCDDKYLRIYMEFVTGGSISSILRMFGALQEKQASVFTKQMLCGLDYLHERHICHRDLKGDNLLVDTQGVLKLADFGTAKELATQTTTIAGTAYFMAPEVIQGVGHGIEADVWSLGCCIIEMLTGKPPFSHLKNQYAIMMHIAEDKRSLGDIFPKQASASCTSFLNRCLVRNPSSRATVKELLKHEWITNPPEAPDGEEVRLLDTGSIHLAGQRSILEARESLKQEASSSGEGPGPGPAGSVSRGPGDGSPTGHPVTHSFNPMDLCQEGDD